MSDHKQIMPSVQSASDKFMDLRAHAFQTSHAALEALSAMRVAKKDLLNKYPEMMVADLGDVEVMICELIGTGAKVLAMHKRASDLLRKFREPLPVYTGSYETGIPDKTEVNTEYHERR